MSSHWIITLLAYAFVFLFTLWGFQFIIIINRRKMIKHGSSIPTGIFSDFFQWFTGVSCRKEQEASRNSPKKIRRFSGRNTASMFPLISIVFLLEPARTSWPGLTHIHRRWSNESDCCKIFHRINHTFFVKVLGRR